MLFSITCNEIRNEKFLGENTKIIANRKSEAQNVAYYATFLVINRREPSSDD